MTAAGQEFLARLGRDPALAGQTRQLLGLTPGASIPLRGAVEASSYITLAEELSRRDRPGWANLATDVHGLPWLGTRAEHHSHGTWARHDACGTVAKLGPGAVDCPACGPEPEVIQVLRAPFAQVVVAERTLKELHRDPMSRRVRRGMIATFGEGTEVTRRRVLVELTDALPEGEDVTSWFR